VVPTQVITPFQCIVLLISYVRQLPLLPPVHARAFICVYVY